MTFASAPAPTPSRLRLIGAFLLVFTLYQAAEGVGARLLHNPAFASGLMLSAFAAAWAAGRWLGWRGFEAYALGFNTRWLGVLGGGMLLVATVRIGALLLGAQFGVYAIAPAPVPPAAVLAASLAAAALTTFVPSVTEDILTRGFWLGAARIQWSGPAFILATSVIYTLNHIFRLSDGPLEWLRLFCFGLAYAAAAWRWRSLWGAVGVHWGWNFTNAGLDLFAGIEAIAPQAASLLSAGAHVLIAGVMILAPRPARAGGETQ